MNTKDDWKWKYQEKFAGTLGKMTFHDVGLFIESLLNEQAEAFGKCVPNKKVCKEFLGKECAYCGGFNEAIEEITNRMDKI